jgi:hypothetical protein
MENTNRLSDVLSDYLALCLDPVDRTPEQRIRTAHQLRNSAHTTEFYALRAAYRDDRTAGSAHAALLAIQTRS